MQQEFINYEMQNNLLQVSMVNHYVKSSLLVEVSDLPYCNPSTENQ